MDLRLFRTAGADDRLLDQPRRIFADGNAGGGGNQQRDAAGLTELQCRLGIFVDEDLLDRGGFGAMLVKHRSQCLVERDQPVGQRLAGIGTNMAVGDMPEAIAVSPDDPPAGAAKPGIEADQDQPSFSITWSETS